MSRPQGRHSSTWWPVGWAHRRLGLGCSAKHFLSASPTDGTRTETGKTGLLFAYYHPMDEWAWPGGAGGAFGQKKRGVPQTRRNPGYLPVGVVSEDDMNDMNTPTHKIGDILLKEAQRNENSKEWAVTGLLLHGPWHGGPHGAAWGRRMGLAWGMGPHGAVMRPQCPTAHRTRRCAASSPPPPATICYKHRAHFPK